METVGEWLTVGQACAVAGVSRRTIYNWLGKGALVTKRTAGGNVRIQRDSLWRSDEINPQPDPAVTIVFEHSGGDVMDDKDRR